MTKQLKKKAVRSGRWVVFGHLFSQVLRLGSNLILTRLLIPEMFGVMALVNVFMMGIAMFSDVGLQQNVVQSKRGEDEIYLNTAWTIQIIRGGLIFLITLMLSLTLYYLGQHDLLGKGTVYAEPKLPFLLAFMSLTALIAGFNSMNLMLLNRKLMIGKSVIIDLLSQIIGLIFMVTAAWYYREIWTLVLGGIVVSIVKMVLSHHYSLGKRNYLKWDKSCAHEIFHFGKWIFISSILGFMLSQGDRLLLGLWVSPDVLGVYSIAFFMAMTIKGVLKKVVSSVFYPVLSEIVRQNPNELKSGYYKIRAKVDLIAMLTAGFMASVGHVLINILYDNRYQEAGWMLETLSFSGVFIGYSMAGVCLMAKGNVKSNTWLVLSATVFLYVSVPITYSYYGLHGAVLMIALNFIIDIPTTFYMLKKEGILNIRKEVRMLPVLLISYGLGQYLITVFE